MVRELLLFDDRVHAQLRLVQGLGSRVVELILLLLKTISLLIVGSLTRVLCLLQPLQFSELLLFSCLLSPHLLGHLAARALLGDASGPALRASARILRAQIALIGGAVRRRVLLPAWGHALVRVRLALHKWLVD